MKYSYSHLSSPAPSADPAYQEYTINFAQILNLSMGYPGMVAGRNKVQGFLLRFNDAKILTSLDQLEGYQENRASMLNEYNRQLVTVYDFDDRAIAQAWTYLMTLTKVKQYRGKKVASGNWTGLVGI